MIGGFGSRVGLSGGVFRGRARSGGDRTGVGVGSGVEAAMYSKGGAVSKGGVAVDASLPAGKGGHDILSSEKIKGRNGADLLYGGASTSSSLTASPREQPSSQLSVSAQQSDGSAQHGHAAAP